MDCSATQHRALGSCSWSENQACREKQQVALLQQARLTQLRSPGGVPVILFSSLLSVSESYTLGGWEWIELQQIRWKGIIPCAILHLLSNSFSTEGGRNALLEGCLRPVFRLKHEGQKRRHWLLHFPRLSVLGGTALWPPTAHLPWLGIPPVW